MYENNFNKRMLEVYENNFNVSPTPSRKFINPYFIPTSNQLLYQLVNKQNKTSLITPQTQRQIRKPIPQTAFRSGSSNQVVDTPLSKKDQLINELGKLKRTIPPDDARLIKKRMGIKKLKEDIKKEKAKGTPLAPQAPTIESRPIKKPRVPPTPTKPSKASPLPIKGFRMNGIWALPPKLAGNRETQIKQLKAWKEASKKATNSPALANIPPNVNKLYTSANAKLLSLEREQKDSLYVPITKMPTTLEETQNALKKSKDTKPYTNPRLTDSQQSKTWKSWKRENTQLKDILEKFKKDKSKGGPLPLKRQTSKGRPKGQTNAPQTLKKTISTAKPDYLNISLEGQANRDDILTSKGKGRGGNNLFNGLNERDSKVYGDAIKNRAEKFKSFNEFKLLASKEAIKPMTAKQRIKLNEGGEKTLAKLRKDFNIANARIDRLNTKAINKVDDPFGRKQGNLRGIKNAGEGVDGV